MSILTRIDEPQLSKLIRNSKESAEAIAIDGDTPDHQPVVRLYINPRMQWLISEYDSEERKFFGLCDLGQGFPELGYVSVDEMDDLGTATVLVDPHFKAIARMSRYAEEAKLHGAIILTF